MDRGLNKAFAPTREQQQQQTKSQKQQQQQKTPLTLRPSTKKTISQPADFFDLGKTTDHRQSTGQIQGTAFMVQSSTLNRLQFVRIKDVSTIENDAWHLFYNDTRIRLRINVYATNGTSIGKAIRRWQENERVVIIMGKDLRVCPRPYFKVTWNGGGTLKRTKKKRFMQILCRLKPYSFRFSSLRTTCCNSQESFLEGIASQFRINENRVMYEYVYVS